MMPRLVHYQLGILVLLWLCIMLLYLWPSPPSGMPTRRADPLTPKRKRSSEPKPFAGLTQKPPCALCEHERGETTPPPPVRPDPMPLTNRRPCVIDTSMHFCPHDGCEYRGWLGLGNLRANGHPSGGPWRQLSCRSCHGYFLESHGTIFHDKRLPLELIVHVLACLAEGLGIRATARVLEVEANTVLPWLVEAAEQLQAFTSSFLCDVQVHQLQLDELYAVLRGLREGQLSAEQTLKYLASGRPWVWTAIDPVSKVLLAIEGGLRTGEMAQRVVHRVASLLAPGCVPACFSDGFKGYLPAIVGHFGMWMQPERLQDKGARRKPRWMPLPGLLYVQVVQQYRRKRVVGVKHRVVFGTPLAIEQILAACGWKINTAMVERLNLDIRQRVAAIGWRVNTLCQGVDSIQQQLAVFHAYHNFVLPHASLRQPLAEPSPTNGTGSAQRWRPGIPAMAVGLTDHGWTLQEVLLSRPRSRGYGTRPCIVLRCRSLIPGWINAHGFADAQMMVLDAMDLAPCRMLHSQLPQRSRGKQGEDHGRGGRGRWPCIPGDWLIMVAEIPADLPLDHRLHEPPSHCEHGQGRHPCGLLPPHGTERSGMLAPATARCHRERLCLIRLEHLDIRTFL